MTYKHFQTDIARMNKTYELEGIAEVDFSKRLIQFYKIIGDEIKEIEELIAEAEIATLTSADHLRIRTGVADLLADLIVYCASEAIRWDIPLDTVLGIVMSSNFSKLDENGKPIKDPETGKFLKGPNYWKPEPLIAKALASKIAKWEDQSDGAVLVTVNMEEVMEAATQGKIMAVSEQRHKPGPPEAVNASDN
jgi:predicted HAD superfamily Cof-like phosphohydrolase